MSRNRVSDLHKGKMKKRRNKKYVPKPKCYPFGIRNDSLFKAEFKLAMDMIGTEKFSLRHTSTLIEHAMMSHRLYGPSTSEELFNICSDSYNNATDDGLCRMDPKDVERVRAIVPDTFEFLMAQSNYNLVKVANSVINDTQRKKFYSLN